MDKMNDYDLVKAVNSAITGRRDHRLAWERFNSLDEGQRASLYEATRALGKTAPDLASFKKDFGDAWESYVDGSSSYFFRSELEAIEAVVGKSW